MNIVKIKLEYSCFPVWIYSENNKLIENVLPPYLIGDDESFISSQTGEAHAYSAKRTFQIESGILIQFENEDNMMVHIWKIYGK